MCGNQRVDHDPKAAVELPEDVGVRHGVACAHKAAQSVRVAIEGGSRGVARANHATARERAAQVSRLAAGVTPLDAVVLFLGVPDFPLVPPARCAPPRPPLQWGWACTQTRATAPLAAPHLLDRLASHPF